MNKMLAYKGYHASVEYNDDDGIFVGSVFGIRDSLNFHGSSVEELRASFRGCIDSYLDMCREFGVSPDKEFKGSFNVRLSPELHYRASLAAEQEGTSLNQFVVTALEQRLQRSSATP